MEIKILGMVIINLYTNAVDLHSIACEMKASKSIISIGLISYIIFIFY